jgi:hypothetical protein
MIVAAGVSALRPVLEIAGVEGPSVTEPSLDGVQRVEDVALAAIKGNYLGPLLSVVTMVCPCGSTQSRPPLIFFWVPDPSYAEHKSLTFRSLNIVARFNYTCTDSGHLRVKQGRFLYPISISRYRKSLR